MDKFVYDNEQVTIFPTISLVESIYLYFANIQLFLSVHQQIASIHRSQTGDGNCSYYKLPEVLNQF